MLKIISIQLNNQPKINLLGNNVFVYGKNGTGKTLLINAIDYMLGHRKNDIWNMQGMDGVVSIKCVFQYEKDSFVYLRRDKDLKLYYKLSDEDAYLPVDLYEYKKKIQDLFAPFDKELAESYYSIVEEELTFRGVTYLNKINQYSLGDSTNIIPEASDVQNYKRINAQTLFFFEKDVQKEINALTDELKSIDEQIKKYNEYLVRAEFAMNGIKNGFDYLSLPYNKNSQLEYFKNTLDSFKKGLALPSERQNGENELLYLAKASSLIDSQILIEKTLKKQIDSVSSRNSKTKSVLSFVKSVLSESEEYISYCEDIENVLREIGKRDVVLSIKDYDKSLENLYSQKKQIDKRIEIIKSGLKEKDYVDISRKVAEIENYFGFFAKDQVYTNYDELKEKRSSIKSKLDDLKHKTKLLNSASLNNYITSVYKSIPTSINFVSEDIEHEVKLSYNPMKRSVSGVNKKKKEEGFTNYIPGSKARQTCWQIVTFLGIHRYIKENFPTFPLVPILMIDGFNEPFDDSGDDETTNLTNLYDFFSRKCEDLEIQLIVTSSVRIDGTLLDISAGLNKEHIA